MDGQASDFGTTHAETISRLLSSLLERGVTRMGRPQFPGFRKYPLPLLLGTGRHINGQATYFGIWMYQLPSVFRKGVTGTGRPQFPGFGSIHFHHSSEQGVTWTGRPQFSRVWKYPVPSLLKLGCHMDGQATTFQGLKISTSINP